MLAYRLLVGLGGTGGFTIAMTNTPHWTDITGLRLRQAEIKDGATPTAGVESTIFELASGAGCIVGLWHTIGALSGGYPGFDTLIRVYTDGSVTPDIEQDLGTFFGYAHATDFGKAALHTTHFMVSNDGASNSKSSGLCLLPIPFSNGVKVTLVGPTGITSGKLFVQVTYALAADNAGWTPPSYRLHTDGVTVLSATAGPAAANDFTLHTITGGPGIVVAHSMWAKSTAGNTYLERNVALTIDGEGAPSIKSSGTEDWWRDPWYFDWGPISSPGALAWGLASATHAFSALVDLAALHGGFAFNSTVTMTWLTNSDTTNDCTQYADCLFYYLKV